MTKQELSKLMEPFGVKLSELNYDYGDFNTEELCDEVCPMCDEEIEVMQNGKSECSSCGHKNVRPCSMCPLNDTSNCDWGKDGCTPFPNEK